MCRENSQNPRPSHLIRHLKSLCLSFLITTELHLICPWCRSRCLPGLSRIASRDPTSPLVLRRFPRSEWRPRSSAPGCGSVGQTGTISWAKRPKNQQKDGWIKIGLKICLGRKPQNSLNQQICDRRNYWKSSPRHDGVAVVWPLMPLGVSCWISIEGELLKVSGMGKIVRSRVLNGRAQRVPNNQERVFIQNTLSESFHGLNK